MHFRFDIKRSTAVLTAALMICFCFRLYAKAKSTDKELQSEGAFVPIIMYHSVVDDESPASEYVVTKRQLECDLMYLKNNGYNTVTINDLIRYVSYKGKLPDKPIVLTFDDGTYNVYKYAMPLLKKYGFKATVSIVGSYAVEATETALPPDPAYSYLSLDEISEMRETGIFEFCNHSYAMHTLNGRRGLLQLENETYEQYRKNIYNDVFAVQQLLEENCGFRPNVYTYPFGFNDEVSRELIKSCGFEATLGVQEKPNYLIKKRASTLFELNRYNRSGYITTEDFMEKALSC